MSWLVPFKGRNEALALQVNALWQHDRLYVMDNHRCALWCWWQHVSGLEQVDLLHVDYHFDALWAGWDKLLASYDQVHRSNLDRYLNAKVAQEDVELYRWDTFVAAFEAIDSARLRRLFCCGVEQGTKPKRLTQNNPIADAHAAVSAAVDPTAAVPWIIDVDLDAFTIRENDGTVTHRVNDEGVRNLGALLLQGYVSGRVSVLTVALSPENTGGWAESERLLDLLLNDWPYRPSFGPA